MNIFARYVTCQIAAMALLSTPLNAEAVEPAPRVQIYVVDCSGSIADLPEPDTMQAMITHAIKVAALSTEPVKFAVIFYGANGVKIIGDEDGMPTAAHHALHQRLLAEWPKPEGPTPMDEALLACINIVKSLPADANTTVIHFGDGLPVSGRVRPDEFPSVAEYMERRLRGVAQGAGSNEDKQQAIESLKREWLDPESEEGERIWELQVKEEFEACLEHAKALRSHHVRFVSVDFTGIEQLREIHEAAGGTDRDYALVQPANTIIDRLHELGLTAFQGVLVPMPVDFEAEQNAFKKTIVHKLDAVADAAVITFAFNEPIDNFDKHLELGVKSGSDIYLLDLATPDPNAVLSVDRAGRVATATVTLPRLSDDGRISIGIRSPKETRHVPGMRLFAHLRLREGLMAVFKPDNADVDDGGPYHVSPNQPVQWRASLESRDTAEPHLLSGLEAILRRRRDHQEIRIDFEHDPAVPGVFLSSRAMNVPQGVYDVEMHFLLPSGLQVRLELSQHVDSEPADEHLTLELDDSSLSRACIDLGEIGDDVCQGTVTVKVRSANVEYALPVSIGVVGLADAEGNALNEPMIWPVRKQMTLSPGRVETVTLQWKVPGTLDGVVDGPFTGELQFIRKDLDEELDVRPYVDGEYATESISDIRFILRRPEFVVASPRGWRDEIVKGKSGGPFLPIHVDIWRPLTRTILLRVGHTSVLPRTVQVDLEVPFREADGRPLRDVSLEFVEGQDLVREIAPKEQTEWNFQINVPDEIDLPQSQAFIRVSGDGLTPLRIPAKLLVRDPLLGGRIRQILWIVLVVCLLGTAIAAIGRRRLRRYQSGRTFEITPEKPFDFISVAATGSRGPELRFDDRDIQYRKMRDSRPRRAGMRLPLDGASITPVNQLIVTKPGGAGEGDVSIAIERVDVEDGGPVLTASVYDAGPSGEKRSKANRKMRRRLLVACLALVLALTLLTPPVTAAAQWLLDVLRV